MSRRNQGASKLESWYIEMLPARAAPRDAEEGWSLQQPSPLKVAPSVVTYGVYEKPIPGGLEDAARAELE